VSTPARDRRSGKPDGRNLRSARTRRAIIDAHNALMLDGDLQPTAARVAERAGVSVGSLWVHFKDLEALFAAAGEKTLQVQYAGYRPVPADLPLAERIERFCAQRARMLESIAGASRAAQIRLPFSRQLRDNRARHNARLREEIELLFEPEIATAGQGARRLVDALLMACTWPAWMGCRDDLGLSVAEAAAVLQLTVTAVLLVSGVPGPPR
jgi:TetR/AcrR family transcriptional regulator, regulator of autoinduction and epiphytic fitness